MAIYSFAKFRSKSLIFNSYVVEGYFLFLALILLVAFIGYLNQVDSEIVLGSVFTVIRSIAIFLVVLCFPCDKKINQRWMKLFFVAYSISVIAMSRDGSYIVRGLEFDSKIFQIDYQTTAVIYALFFVLIVPVVEFKWRLFYYLVSGLALFSIGARSEFVGFFPMIALIEFLLSNSSVSYFAKIFALIVIIVCSGYFLYSEYSENRIFNLINMNDDASAIARYELTARAWESIKKSPLFGDYASYALGEYSHNLLSAWVDLGMFGVLLLIFILFYQGRILLKGYARKKMSVEYIRAAAIFFLLIIMLATAKAYTYPLLPISIAFYVVYRRSAVS
jgi:hypothetical protein